MSISAISWAKDLSLPSTDKFVLIALCEHYNDDQRCAWMKQSTLADWTGLRRETVNAALSRLEHEHGIVESQQRKYADGRQATKVYTINFRADIPLTETAKRRIERRNPSPVSEAHTAEVRVVEANSDRVSDANNKNREHRTVKTPMSASPPSSPKNEQEPLIDDAPIPSAQGKRDAREKELADKIQEIWNEHRGPLPKSMSMTARRKQIRKVLSEVAGDDEGLLLEMVEGATKYAATLDWWIQKKLTLTNLLRPEHLQSKYESYVAEFEDSRIVEVVPGSRVAFKRMVGSRKETFRGLVKEVTDEQVVVQEDGFGGRTYRIPRRDVVEQI